MTVSTTNRVLNTLQLSRDYNEKPPGLKWRSNTLFIVSTVGIGLFTDLFLYGLVVPILPFMLQDRVGVPEDRIQSNVSGLLAAYAAAAVITSPIAGILADRISTRQAPFLVGLTALLMATILLFVGTSLPVLAIARIFQGISGAFVWTIGLALCLETVGPENLGKTIGSMFSFISVGTLCAPVIGGVLYEKTGYAGVFGICFGILAVDFIMRALVIEKKVAKRYEAQNPDAVSDLNTTPSEQQPHAQIDEEENRPNNNDDETQPLLRKKTKQKEDLTPYTLSPHQPQICHSIPILPCLTSPRLLTALLVAFVQACLLGSFDATIPTIASSYYGFDSLKSGILFLPLGISDFLLGPLFGWAVDRYGTKPIAVGAYAYLVPVLALLRLPHPGGLRQVLLHGGLLALSAAGLAGIGAPSIVEAGAVVQKYYEANPEFFGESGPYAQLYGLNSMVFSAGLTLGPELAGELKEVVGYGNMNAVLAGLCAITAGLCWAFVGGRPGVLGGGGK